VLLSVFFESLVRTDHWLWRWLGSWCVTESLCFPAAFLSSQAFIFNAGTHFFSFLIRLERACHGIDSLEMDR
jgi:hypothetical protein